MIDVECWYFDYNLISVLMLFEIMLIDSDVNDIFKKDIFLEDGFFEDNNEIFY